MLHEIRHAFGMDDTYVAHHNGNTGALGSTCDVSENQPYSIMCLHLTNIWRKNKTELAPNRPLAATIPIGLNSSSDDLDIQGWSVERVACGTAPGSPNPLMRNDWCVDKT